MAPKRKGLGRGLDALIRDVNATAEEKETPAAKPEAIEEKKTPEKKPTKKTPAAKGKAGSASSSTSTKKAVAKPQNNKKTATKPAETGKKSAKKAEGEPKKSKTEAEAKPETKSADKAEPKPELKPVAKAESKPETASAVSGELKVKGGETTVRLSLVEPNREQPRKTFSDESIKELADSIRQFGVIQPLLVQLKDDHYEIIAGERRWRAAKEAGLKEIPVLVREYSSQEAVEVSLIENIQREDLNPIEEAKAYRNLMTDFDLKQEDVAKRVSKSRAAVANSMRLLKLDPRVQELVIDGKLTEGHARALLALENGDQQLSVAEEIIKNHLTVRQVEQLIRKLTRPAAVKKTAAVDPQREAVIMDISEKLKRVLGTKVEINQISKKKGRIEIEFYSEDDLERVYELLMTVQGD